MQELLNSNSMESTTMEPSTVTENVTSPSSVDESSVGTTPNLSPKDYNNKYSSYDSPVSLNSNSNDHLHQQQVATNKSRTRGKLDTITSKLAAKIAGNDEKLVNKILNNNNQQSKTSVLEASLRKRSNNNASSSTLSAINLGNDTGATLNRKNYHFETTPILSKTQHHNQNMFETALPNNIINQNNDEDCDVQQTRQHEDAKIVPSTLLINDNDNQDDDDSNRDNNPYSFNPENEQINQLFQQFLASQMSQNILTNSNNSTFLNSSTNLFHSQKTSEMDGLHNDLLEKAILNIINQNQETPTTSNIGNIINTNIETVNTETVNNTENTDSNNTIYRGLYPIKEVKEYFTKIINDEGEKVYLCQYPGCSFQTKQYSQHISRHIYLKHIGIKKELRCRECDKCFQRPESLVQHEKNHVCGFGIDQDRMNDPTNPCGKINIKKHFKKVTDHEFDVYQCQFGDCTFHTNNSGSIRRHVHNQHICAYASVNNHSGQTTNATTNTATLAATAAASGASTAAAASASASTLPSASLTSSGTVNDSAVAAFAAAFASTLSNHNTPNQYATLSNALLNTIHNLNPDNNIHNTALRTSNGNFLSSWPEVTCQLFVKDEEYKPEAINDEQSSKPSSNIGGKSDDEDDDDDDGPMNLAQPDCPITNPIDQQHFDDNPLDNTLDEQILTKNQQFNDNYSTLQGPSNVNDIISQGTNSGSGNANKKNVGLYSLKNYKPFYVKKKTEDGNGCVFFCLICKNFEATQQISLIRHIWSEISYSQFACEFEGCDEKFTSEFARYRHRKTVHHQGQTSSPSRITNDSDNPIVNESVLSNQRDTKNNSISVDLLKAYQNRHDATFCDNEIPKQFQSFRAPCNNPQDVPERMMLDDSSSEALLSKILSNKTANDNERYFFNQNTLQMPKNNQQLIKLLQAPSGSLLDIRDYDSMSNSSSEPPKKRTKMSPKSDSNNENRNQTGMDNSFYNLPSTSSALPDNEFFNRTNQTTEQNNNSQTQKPKNPAKSGLYSLKTHQDHFDRKKKEGGTGYEYSCRDCQGYTTSSQASMVRHIWSHSEQVFICNVCDQKFENEFNLYKHKKSEHPEATTQHNRGVKGSAKKQAQFLKKQQQQQQQQQLQQQQQQLQQQRQLQNNQIQDQQLNQRFIQSDLSHQNILNQLSELFTNSSLSNNINDEQQQNNLFSGMNLGLPFSGLNMSTGNTRNSLEFLQFIFSYIQNQQQQQQQQTNSMNSNNSLIESFLANNELSNREMSNNNRSNYNVDDDEDIDDDTVDDGNDDGDNVKQNSTGMDKFSTYLKNFDFLRASSTVNSSDVTSTGNESNLFSGVSRRALQFKQKNHHEKTAKFRTIEDRLRHGNHKFENTTNNGDDDDDVPDEDDEDDVEDDECFDQMNGEKDQNQHENVDDDDCDNNKSGRNGYKRMLLNSNNQTLPDGGGYGDGDDDEDDDDDDMNNNVDLSSNITVNNILQTNSFNKNNESNKNARQQSQHHQQQQQANNNRSVKNSNEFLNQNTPDNGNFEILTTNSKITSSSNELFEQFKKNLNKNSSNRIRPLKRQLSDVDQLTKQQQHQQKYKQQQNDSKFVDDHSDSDASNDNLQIDEQD